MKLLLISIAVLLLLPPLGLATNKASFDIQDIHFSDKITKIVAIDLNGDSLKEVIVFTDPGKNKRKNINIIWQTPSGFSEKAVQSFTPAKEIILFDFGDVAPSPGKEFIFLTANGVYFYPQTSSNRYDLKKQKLIRVASIFKNSDNEKVFYWDFVKNISGSNRPEIFIPQFTHYLIYTSSESDGWIVQSKLHLPAQTSIQAFKNLSIRYSPRELHLADCNLDGLRDVITKQKGIFSIFYQKTDGSFSREPDITFDMKFNSEDSDRPEEIKINALKDLNGDGLIDLLAMKISARESVLNPQSQMQIYFGKKGTKRLFSLTPDQIIVSSGIQFDDELLDFNNDHKIDLAIPSMKLGLMRIIKMLLTKSATISINIYQMNEQGVYPKLPDLEKKIVLKFSFSMGDDSAGGSGTVPVFRLNGDYNGDGYLDLISAVSQNKFNIFFGGKGQIFSSTPDLEFNVKLPMNGKQVRVFDLDDNGKSDIIITYRKQDDKTGELRKTVRILMNRM